MAAIIIDVRTIAPPERHPHIFATFDQLPVGEHFVLVNDHDPRPLYYQFLSERQGVFEWNYEEKGPDLWRVQITRTAASAEGHEICCGHCGG
jgi:uncharacterized protein (DUF2249 family)